MNALQGRGMIAALVVLVLVVITAASSLYTVDQTEQVLVVQFGRPVRVVTKPGLHGKLPFIQSVIPFDKRLLAVETPSEQVILGDQRRLVVDSFTIFRIADPLRYYQAVGSVEDGITGRLDAIVSASLRRVLGNYQLLDVLSAKRDRIMSAIRNEVNAEMQGFGVAIEDVRIRRADLPEENTKAILHRMQSERQRVAAEARAQGAEAATKIRADAERERTVLLADARAKADALRGEGEAEAIHLYAQAYGQDPHFFGVWKTLEAYRTALTKGKDRLVLTPGTDFLRYLATPPAAP